MILNTCNFWTQVGIQSISLFLPLLTSLAIFFIQRNSSRNKIEKREGKLFLSEMKDLKRHIRKGIYVLNEIDLSKGRPSSMHFVKLKISQTFVVFSEKTYRGVDDACFKELSHIRLNFRNFNKDIDAAISYLSLEDLLYNKMVMQEYLDYLKDRSNHLNKKVAKLIKELEISMLMRHRCPCKFKSLVKEVILRNNEDDVDKNIPPIIYHLPK